MEILERHYHIIHNLLFKIKQNSYTLNNIFVEITFFLTFNNINTFTHIIKIFFQNLLLLIFTLLIYLYYCKN